MVLGVLLPWLVTVGMIAALIIWIVRRRRRAATASAGTAAVHGDAHASSASSAKP